MNKLTASDVDLPMVLAELESTSSSSVYKALVEIRTNIVTTDLGIGLLRDSGGLKLIVKQISKMDNDKILNVCLSVLANCCLTEICRLEVISYGIIPHLVTILLNTEKDSAIQCRVCRLVGNLAQSFKVAGILHKNNVVLPLVNILRSKPAIGTQLMAIRALRVLWNVVSCRDAMLNAGVVKAVCSELNSDKPEVAEAALRATATFTMICANATVVQVAGDGTGYHVMVSNIGKPAANQCIYNLSGNLKGREMLSRENVMEALVTKLREHHDSLLVNAFLLLCRESLNRAKLRHIDGGLKLMLDILKEPSGHHRRLSVMLALTHFAYDQHSQQILVQAGLVETLISMLAAYISVHGSEHNAEERWADAIVAEGQSPAAESGLSPCGSGSRFDSWSPLRGDLEVRSPSPALLLPASSYSPLCDSDGSADEDDIKANSPMDTDTDLQPALNESSLRLCSELSEEELILDLLTTITYLEPPVEALAWRATLTTLIDIIALIRTPLQCKAGKLFCLIASKKNYYQQLMNQNTVLSIHSRLCRRLHSEFGCVHCDQMATTGSAILAKITQLAESGLGEGDMAYRLLKGEVHTKRLVAVTIPLVIKDTRLLQRLLLALKGWDHLLDCLQCVEMRENSVAALNALFVTLGITSPKEATLPCTQCDVRSLAKEATVTFILDDGSTVSANRAALCLSSPVFEAMFLGGFRESEQTDIHLRDISANCLTHFLRIVDTFCECQLPKDVSTLLELVVATDRFLVPNLTSCILAHIMNYALTHHTAHLVYSWAVETGFKIPIADTMAYDVVRFVFCHPDLINKWRVQSVSAILEQPEQSRFISDITEIVEISLNSRKRHMEVLRTVAVNKALKKRRYSAS